MSCWPIRFPATCPARRSQLPAESRSCNGRQPAACRYSRCWLRRLTASRILHAMAQMLNEDDRLCVNDFASPDHRGSFLQCGLDHIDIFALLLEPAALGHL